MIASTVALLACSPGARQKAEQVLLNELERGGSPSVQYFVFNRREVLYTFRQGMASIEAQQPAASRTSYNLYSITKTVTALAVLRLAEQGRVRLDAPVKEYLPSTPLPAEVTVRHLLSHTSGISDPIPLSWIHLASAHKRFRADDFFQPILLSRSEPKFRSGEKFRYSNLGYLVLGQLIGSVSGMTYEEYVKRHVLERLAIAPEALSFWIQGSGRHATGYHRRWSFSSLLLSLFLDKEQYMGKAVGAWRPFRPLYVNGAAYGGLVGTPEGLIRYLQEYLRPESQIITTATKEQLFTETEDASGKPTGMCLSWFTGTLNGVRYYTHAGGGGGYYVEVRLYPEQGLGTLVMFNRTGMRDERFLDRVDTFFLSKAN
ncbi:serine hydrolase domain-containing protein [Pontibacter anaerobius]|uniref:Serine hydrolase n=1 Tax=Pontibacter anaerobius TaxID=2993940 RepID=A0ABT3RBD8_9BACT|nr:serine hydrolase domain-containing protein [Pontibacter anaerobius]MCX2739070.1 serine hydrolase [Pontibacter anaerobius]